MKLAFLFLLFIFILGCAQPKTAEDTFERIRQQAIDNAGSDFEKLCYEHHHAWMKMMPMVEGASKGEEACFGCMPESNTHICDAQEYREYMKNR